MSHIVIRGARLAPAFAGCLVRGHLTARKYRRACHTPRGFSGLCKPLSALIALDLSTPHPGPPVVRDSWNGTRESLGRVPALADSDDNSPSHIGNTSGRLDSVGFGAQVGKGPMAKVTPLAL